MRNHKWLARGSALLLCASMAAQTFPEAMVLQAASEEETATESSSQQIVSQPSTVYINRVSGDERSVNFNENWRFYLGEAGNAWQSTYDDAKWDNISLPHDYSISQPYDESLEGESGFLPGGLGWYRKTFTLDESLKGKRIRLDFDGVYMNATVYVNGHELGTHPYGYTPFSYDLTDWIDYEGENTIAVRVDHRLPSSRWYSGSGIYRDVHLTITNDVHVDLYGTVIRSDQLEEQKDGLVDTDIVTTVVNDGDQSKTVTLVQSIVRKGEEAEAPIASVTSDPIVLEAGKSADVAQTLQVSQPDLWSVDNPNLYTILTTVVEDGQTVDAYETEYGYRYFAFEAETGFWLNGENMKLNGVCMHHDQGALGSAANERAIERQMEIMKNMGVNAIRVTHNPASQALLDVCARMGILVVEEFFDTWANPKNGNTEDYSNYFLEPIGQDNPLEYGTPEMTWAQYDLQITVKRGRSNPAIIMWSLGNEIFTGATSMYPTYANNLIAWTQELDDRPVTLGDNKMLGNDTNEARAIRQAIANAGGVIGSNYGRPSYIQSAYRSVNPEWCYYGSENVSAVNSRGVYDRIGNATMASDLLLTSYDYSCVSWGHTASDSMLGIHQYDFMAGQFVWTGFDYIGEPTPWNGISAGPTAANGSPTNSYFGIVDTAGFEKDTYYFYMSQWRDDVTTLHMLPAWKSDVVYRNAAGNVPVVVYSNASSVELFFTPEGETQAQSLGKKTFTKKTTEAGHTYQIYEGADKESATHRNLYLTWYVPYADGTLQAVGYDEQGNVIETTEGRNSVSTYGEAASLKASADRDEISADGSDLVYISVDVLDADGKEVADADNRVTFSVEGDGVLVGVDNGSQGDQQSYQDDNRQAFSGKVLAIVQSTKANGTITVTASSPGLVSDTITVTTSGAKESEEGISALEYARSYYIRTGMSLDLPETVTAIYTDGTREKIPVLWSMPSDEQLNTPGDLIVKGDAGGLAVSVGVHVIDEIGALQNYSALTPTGVLPELPETRPVILQDGTILEASFAVEWEEMNPQDFETPGLVVIQGSADVMGQTESVSATIRVADPEQTLGDNVMSYVFALEQDIPEDYQSDSLDAIRDGSHLLGAGGGVNTTVWTNYNWSQAGHNTATITMSLDTMQLLSQAVIWFGDDGWSMTQPDAGTTVLEVSNDGENWTVVDATESIGQAEGSVQPYTYDFEPVRATFVRLSVTNNATRSMPTGFTCTGITEMELYPAVISQVVGTSAQLESLKINGQEVGASELASGVVSTPAWIAEIEAVGKDNASVTVLPVWNDEIRIIVEAEDHSATSTVVVRLKQPEKLPADDDSLDYPVSMLTASADSVYPGTGNEGPVHYVLDGNAATYWHTNWNTSEASNVSKRFVDLTFETPQEVGALRYLPRNTSGSGGQNGMVVDYKVQYKASEDGDWIDISSGTWEKSADWKIAMFNEPVVAKSVRLIGVSTMTNGVVQNTDMSAAELRLAAPSEKQSLADAEVILPDVVYCADLSAGVDLKNELQVVVAGQTLRWGMDYLLEYENIDAYGTALVRIRGIGSWSGEVERTFQLMEPKTPEVPDEPVESNKVLLQLAVVYARAAQQEEGYAKLNGLVKAQFEQALAKAEAVLEDESATQEEVDAIWMELTHLIHMLDFTSDKGQLAQLIEQAQEIADELDLWQGDLDAFLSALEQAREVLDRESALDESITQAYEALASAMAALERKPDVQLDLTLLRLLVSQVEPAVDQFEKYVTQGQAEFLSALQQGKAVLENPQSQEEIDQAVSVLHEAYLNLRLKADESLLTQLQSLMDSLKDLKAEAYTRESWAVYEDALAQARLAAASGELEQIEQARARLESAKAALVEKQSTKQSAAVSTSSQSRAGIFTALGAAALALAAGFFSSQRKERRDKK